MASIQVNDSVNNDKVINKDLSNLSQSIVVHKSFNGENVVQRNLNTDGNIELLSQSVDDIEILIEHEKDTPQDNYNGLTSHERKSILNNIIPINKIEDFAAMKLEMQHWYAYANKMYFDLH